MPQFQFNQILGSPSGGPFLLTRFGIACFCLSICIQGCTKSDSHPTENAVRQSDSPPVSESATTANSGDLKDLFELTDPSTSRKAVTANVVFRDVASDVGVLFQRFSDVVPERYFLPEVMGGGVAWIDFDADGLLDLYAVNGCRIIDADPNQKEHTNRLYRHRGTESFEDVTSSSGAGDNRYGQGCAVGDFNSDGFADLYLTNYGRNTLLVSNGDGTFSDTTMLAGVGDESWGTSAVWLDANADGYADLYVVNYVDVTPETSRVCTYGGVRGYCGPGQWEGVRDLLYLGVGDGTFSSDATAEAVDSRFAKGLAVAVCDFDADLSPEIYVCNDMAPNFLLTRREESGLDRPPLYKNVAEAAGCAVSGDGRNEASMGVACGDFDNDGQVDIFLAHYYQQKNTLYHNLGSLLFEDDSQRTRIAATSFDTLGFGTVAFDFDHDGDEDLFIANGHVLGPAHTPNEMRPQLLANDGTGIFEDLMQIAGGYFDRQFIGRGAAGGDFNNDGKIDLAVSHVDQPLAILRNESNTSENHFIGLELMPRNRIFPAGGHVVVTAGDHRRVIPIVGGGSYLSSGDPRLVIGLGTHGDAVDITVAWPSGELQSIPQLDVDRYWRVREGKTRPMECL